ncbi:MAG: response regulator [Desulfuromonadales bacterium]|nr:response regulator [Desulfuromonadales bacterium]
MAQEPNKNSVLVVEDELVSQTCMKDVLAKANYHVLVANNGLEGFNTIIASKPQVILTDKVMPKFDDQKYGFF